MTVFMFPGQGSQKIGMGKELFDNFKSAKDVFEEVNDALSFSLSDLIFQGDEKDLSLTNNAQPAIMAVSIAVVEVLKQEFGLNLNEQVSYVAGHSLGEYSALCCSGAINVQDTAKILKQRGQAMLDASPKGVGAMAAILGQSEENVQDLINNGKIKDQICVIANYNIDGQIVISGHVESIDNICLFAKQNKIKAVKLPVSGAFHSPLMKQAENKLISALNDITMKQPQIKIIPNVLAKPINQDEDIKQLLIQQITGSVKWKQTLDFLFNAKVNSFVEVGCGNVLYNLVKKVNKEVKIYNLQTINDIEDYVKTISSN